jgi:chromate transport protein ChrA
LAGLASEALTVGGFTGALAAFAVAVLAFVVVLFILAALIARAQERVVQGLQAGAPEVKRWGGYILLLIGAWFVILAIFASFFAHLFPV